MAIASRLATAASPVAKRWHSPCMEPNPDHPSPFATGRVRLDDGTERLLAFPLQRLAARLIDFVVASLATILVVTALMHLLDAVWTCGACPFVETEPTQTQPAPAATTEPTAPTIAATSQEPGDCPDPPADVGDGPEPAQGPTTLEQVLVLVGMTLYEIGAMLAGAKGSSVGRHWLGIRAIDAHRGGALRWGALLNRWAVIGLGFLVILVLRSLHPAWYVYALAAGSGVTMFFNASRQAWHDIAAASVVVRDPERCPPETAPRSGTLWTPHS